MTPIKALILGLIQGIAEFLPISSSGHLEIFKEWLGLSDVPLVFDIVLHLATLLVLIIQFRARIAELLVAAWNWVTGRGAKAQKQASAGTIQINRYTRQRQNETIILLLIVATIITGIMGYFIDKLPTGGVRVNAIELLITAVVLALTVLVKPDAKGASRGPEETGVGRAAFIGFAQGLGVFSGISRSGFTISAGLFAGLDREWAGEFSFLLAIPAVLGAFLLKLKDLGTMIAEVSLGNVAIAFVIAFVSGWFALKFLLKVIKNGKLYWFAPYLVLIGIIGLIIG
jgi:undecaprenyl-diphosphatase